MKPAVARKPLGKFGNALRMDEQGYAEFFRLGPYRVELRIGEFDAVDDIADGRSLQALLLHRGLEFLHGKIGRLQGQRSESRKTVGP